MKIVSIILVAGLFLGGCSSKDENGFPECKDEMGTKVSLKFMQSAYGVSNKDKLVDIITISTSPTIKKCRATFKNGRVTKRAYYRYVKTDDGKILAEI